MGAFTKLDDPRIDGIVRDHVARIVEEIRALVPEATAIYLTGGFGRGEGAVVARDGGWTPVNDYDFTVVGRMPHAPVAALRRLGDDLARRIGVPFVDIGWLSEASLPSLMLTMDTYDFRYAASLVHGDDVRGRLPAFPEGELPWFEFVRLLCNRAAGLLTADLPHRARASSYRNSQVIKAYVAVGDAVVALTRSYHHLYAERLARFAALERTSTLPAWLPPDAVELVGRAYRAKLSLLDADFTSVEPRAIAAAMAAAFCALVERAVGRRCSALQHAEGAALRAFGVRTSHVLRRLARTARRGNASLLVIEPAKLSRYVMLTQVPMYVAHATGAMHARAAYLRRYWWLPGALGRPWDGVGAAHLWERYVH